MEGRWTFGRMITMTMALKAKQGRHLSIRRKLRGSTGRQGQPREACVVQAKPPTILLVAVYGKTSDSAAYYGRYRARPKASLALQDQLRKVKAATRSPRSHDLSSD